MSTKKPAEAGGGPHWTERVYPGFPGHRKIDKPEDLSAAGHLSTDCMGFPFASSSMSLSSCLHFGVSVNRFMESVFISASVTGYASICRQGIPIFSFSHRQPISAAIEPPVRPLVHISGRNNCFLWTCTFVLPGSDTDHLLCSPIAALMQPSISSALRSSLLRRISPSQGHSISFLILPRAIVRPNRFFHPS